MATNFKSNPWIIPNADDGDLTTAIPTYRNGVSVSYHIVGIRWTGAANTNTCVVANKDANTKWAATAATGHLDCVYDGPPIPMKGLIITSNGGTTYIYTG